MCLLHRPLLIGTVAALLAGCSEIPQASDDSDDGGDTGEADDGGLTASPPPVPDSGAQDDGGMFGAP